MKINSTQMYLQGLIVFCLLLQSVAFSSSKKETQPAAASQEVGSETTPAKKEKQYSKQQLVLKAFVEKLFTASQNVNDPKKKKAARKSIETSVDWQKIAMLSMGTANWKKYPKGRLEFQNILKKIISLTAYSRMDSFWGSTKYEFKEITLIGKSKAEVVAVFEDENEEEYELSYYLHKTKKGWKIYDIAFDGIQYAQNINAQIEFFLKEQKGNKFEALMGKMRKRLKDL